MPRPPNFKQDKRRREDAQKRRNQEKQQQKAARKGGERDAPAAPDASTSADGTAKSAAAR
jgi:hypothetical protein